MGLNDSFAQIHTQLLLMESEPSIQRVFSIVAQEVEQRAIILPSPPISATTLLAKASSGKVSNRNSGNSSKKKERLVCTHCNIQGHTVDRCYKLHGFPPNYRNQKSPLGKSHTSSAKYIFCQDP